MTATLEVQGVWSSEVEETRIEGHAALSYRLRPRSLADLLVDARRWSGRTFVVEGNTRLGFEDFQTAVRNAASLLADQGIHPGDRVMLLGFNSLSWLIAFWSLQYLGAVTVLGNSWWSPGEAQAALDLADPAFVITDRTGEKAVSGKYRSMGFAALRADLGHSLPSTPMAHRRSEDDTAIIMFSSGTTGAAKGVVMTHRSVISNIQNLLVLTGRLPNALDPAVPGTVSLLTVPLFHLSGIQISFTTLLSGGALVLLEGKFDPTEVLKLIQQEKVRVWGSIPTMVSRVIDSESFADFDTSSVRSIPMGGAAVSPELRAKVQQAFPAIQQRVGSLYGLTEAGGVLAAGSASDLRGRPGCVGKPLPVVQIRIDAPDTQGVGEILARTPSMISGYWRDATPITDAAGWLRTGDIGSMDADGYLFVVGRSKDIIIRGGENIASAHVENSLLSHPSVRECAVLALPHADLGEEVAAAVVLRPGVSLTASDLAHYVRASLGKFQIPSRWWLRRDALPTNASGKVLKRELIAHWQDRQTAD